jgi:autophagy-related protein 5
MSFEDREVLREVWEGRVPAVFRLSEDDCVENPDPTYLLLPRLSYLPLATDKVKKYFLKFIPEHLTDNDMWFSCGGSPLKWHHPIGVLYDIHGGSLPWDITVHFSSYPQNELIPCGSRDVVESHFMSRVKEADQMKHGGRVVSAMQKKDHNQLWLGLQNDKFDQFWAINRRLMEVGTGEEGFKFIPVRLYMAESGTVLQKLVKPVSEGGDVLMTLGEMAANILDSREGVRLVTQGIEPNWDTPLQWLSQHLSYPDNFLHIAVH